MTFDVTIIGHRFLADFGPKARYEFRFVDDTHLDVVVLEDATYASGTVNHFDIAMTRIRTNVDMVTWIEPATGNTVTHVEDFESGVVFTNITDLASKQFWRLAGQLRPID